jgi:hypothetical protein
MKECMNCGAWISGSGDHCSKCGRHCANCGRINYPQALNCGICHKPLLLALGVKPQETRLLIPNVGRVTISPASAPPPIPDGYNQKLRFLMTGPQVWLMVDGFAFDFIPFEEWKQL